MASKSRAGKGVLRCCFLPTDWPKPKAGIIIARKIAGTAVARNRWRRHINQVLAEYFGRWGSRPIGAIVVTVLKSPADQKALESDLEECLRKLSLD